MIYEFIATITAGFALAGIALIIRHLTKLIFKKEAPKWLIPLFAFIGIMGFQIQQEYTWFAQKQNILPEGLQVVKTVEGTTWYRPWTYAKAQTVSVMAVDINSIEVNEVNPSLKRTNIYLFERRMSGQTIPQAFDCANGKRADIQTNQEALNWIDIETTDKLYKTVCQ